MNLTTDPKMVFIVGGDPEISKSQRCLLETMQKTVHVFERYRDFLKLDTYREDDIVLMDMCEKSRGNFRLLNLFLTAGKSPKILIITCKDQIFQIGDKLLNGDSEILFKPFGASDLVDAIERLE